MFAEGAGGPSIGHTSSRIPSCHPSVLMRHVFKALPSGLFQTWPHISRLCVQRLFQFLRQSASCLSLLAKDS